MVEFEMSQADMDALLRASMSGPYIIANGTVPSSPRERCNALWRAMGERMGFVWDTAHPAPGKGDRYFLAQPVAPTDQPAAIRSINGEETDAGRASGE